jgi:hypothetical protein
VPLFGGCASRDLEENGKLADELDVPAGHSLMGEAVTRSRGQGQMIDARTEGHGATGSTIGAQRQE